MLQLLRAAMGLGCVRTLRVGTLVRRGVEAELLEGVFRAFLSDRLSSINLGAGASILEVVPR
jgi:hypothetical protein